MLHQRYARLEIVFYLIDKFFIFLNREAKHLYINSQFNTSQSIYSSQFKELKSIEYGSDIRSHDSDYFWKGQGVGKLVEVTGFQNASNTLFLDLTPSLVIWA